MITANDLFLQQYTFTPADQQGEPTTFRLRVVSEDERTEIIFLNEISKNPGKAMNYAIERCVVGWENFKNAEGKAISFSEKNTRMIPFAIRTEIFGEVMSKGQLSDNEIKN